MSDPAAALASMSLDDRLRARRKQPTILLVDDIPENLKVLAEMLLQAGYSPRPVTSARDGLALLEKVPVDLVLLDVNMPGMNGFEMCSELKSDPRYMEIPVIFLSAATDTTHKVEGFRRGGVDYIGKPFQFEEVQARLENHLRIRDLQREQDFLLDNTLHGVVVALAECLELAIPEVTTFAQDVRKCVEFLVDSAALDDAWEFKVAGSLAFVGCLAIPHRVLGRYVDWSTQDQATDEAFRKHAAVGQAIIDDIPLLDVVAQIVGGQYDPDHQAHTSRVREGARLLMLAREYTELVSRGASDQAAIDQLGRTFGWAERWLSFLVEAPWVDADSEKTEGTLKDLPVGAMLTENVLTVDGQLLLGKGYRITKVLRSRLAEYIDGERLENWFHFELP